MFGISFRSDWRTEITASVNPLVVSAMVLTKPVAAYQFYASFCDTPGGTSVIRVLWQPVSDAITKPASNTADSKLRIWLLLFDHIGDFRFYCRKRLFRSVPGCMFHCFVIIHFFNFPGEAGS